MTSEANASESLFAKPRLILDMLVKGEFVEGMEKYYADDVVNEKPTGATTHGKLAFIENEKNILQRAKTYHGIEIKAVGVGEDDGRGNGVTFGEYIS